MTLKRYYSESSNTLEWLCYASGETTFHETQVEAIEQAEYELSIDHDANVLVARVVLVRS